MARGNTLVTTDTSVASTGVVKSPNSCWRYMQGSYCPEELCHYQHGPPLHGTRLPRRTAASYGRTACLYFAQGYCKYGEKCSFAHIALPSGSHNNTPTDGTAKDSWPAHAQNLNDAESEMRRPPHQQDAASWVPAETSEYPVGYVAMRPGRPATWNDQDEGDELESAAESTPYLDKSRSRQVYDDKKVLVLSGGVMLGRPDQPQVSPPPAFASPASTIHPPVQPLQIVPPPIIPSGPVPSLHSSASSFSSGEYLPSPVDAYEVPMVPSFVPVPHPTPWAFGFPPQHTTITMKPARPPASQHRSKRERHVQPVSSNYPVSSDRPTSPSPPLEVDLASKLSALQLERPAKTDGYVSDEATPASKVVVSNISPPSSSPATPFRRSSLTAGAELGGKRRDVSGAILREPHATHRRGRPSM